jgi:hypothetical protein
MRLTNGFQGGTDGTTITGLVGGNSGGASGDYFDQVTGPVTFAKAASAHDTMGMSCAAAAGEAYAMWSTQLGGTFTILYARSYLRNMTAPAANTKLMSIIGDAGATVGGRCVINSAGKIILSDTAGTAQGATSNTVVTGRAAPVRIEFKIIGNTSTGLLECLIFLTGDAVQPDEVMTRTAVNTGTTALDRIRFGPTGTAVTSTVPVDDVGITDVDYMGPVGAGNIWPSNRFAPQRRPTRVRFRTPVQGVAATGPSTFFQNLGGTITPTGDLVKADAKPLAGTVTPAGALTKQTNKPLTGNITPTGALVRSIGKVLGGTLTPTGTLVRSIAKSLTGSITPAGTLIRQTQKRLTGTITPSGALTTSLVKLLTLAGSLTPSGALVRQTQKTVAGTLTPVGTLVRATAKTVTGGVTPTGALARQVGKRVTGTLTPAGTMARSTVRRLTGATSPAGTVVKRVSKSFTGSLSPPGAVLKLVSKLLGGGITPAGTVDPSILGPTVDITATARALPPAFARALRQTTTGEAMPAPAGHAIGPTATASAEPSSRGRALE